LSLPHGWTSKPLGCRRWPQMPPRIAPTLLPSAQRHLVFALHPYSFNVVVAVHPVDEFDGISISIGVEKYAESI
jgi:hypothetical protein